ncbi:hypothetical protein CA850_29155 [Micromonospora echinospora]|nr:hypothetical protein CA850_29155 [Micromonospora echinospora]
MPGRPGRGPLSVCRGGGGWRGSPAAGSAPPTTGRRRAGPGRPRTATGPAAARRPGAPARAVPCRVCPARSAVSAWPYHPRESCPSMKIGVTRGWCVRFPVR